MKGSNWKSTKLWITIITALAGIAAMVYGFVVHSDLVIVTALGVIAGLGTVYTAAKTYQNSIIERTALTFRGGRENDPTI